MFWPSGIDCRCLPFGCVSVCVCVRACVCINHLLVRAITRVSFKLGSPNVNQRCKTPWLKSLFEQLNLTFKIKFNFDQRSKFTPFWACPHLNSSPVQARITKFGPEVQNSLAKIPIFGVQLTLTFKVKFDLKSQIFWFHHYCKYITTT